MDINGKLIKMGGALKKGMPANFKPKARRLVSSFSVKETMARKHEIIDTSPDLDDFDKKLREQEHREHRARITRIPQSQRKE